MEIFVAILIGVVTLYPSVAFGYLSAKTDGEPVLLPVAPAEPAGPAGRDLVRARVPERRDHRGRHDAGVHMVMAIRGADTPVVDSMLKGYSVGARPPPA